MGHSFTSKYKRTWIRKFICVDCGQEFQIAQKGIIPPLALEGGKAKLCSECSEKRRRDEEHRRRQDYIRNLRPSMGPSTRRKFKQIPPGVGKKPE